MNHMGSSPRFQTQTTFRQMVGEEQSRQDKQHANKYMYI